MLKNEKYYLERAEQLKNQSKTAAEEATRLLSTIKLEDIEHIKHITNTQNTHSYYITLKEKFDGYNNKVYSTKKMSKKAFKIFNKILPLHEHEKMEEPIITPGLLDGIENHNIFKSFR